MVEGQRVKASAKIFAFALGIAACLVAGSNRAGAQAPPSAQSSDSLYRTIAGLDSAMFDAYNKCDLVRLGSFFAEDLEFYHDQTGLARGRQPFLTAIRENICGKVRRDLVKGSLEVYPLKTYGAVETGDHMFCDPRVHRVCDETFSGIAKFVMLWEQKDGAWRITRVISYNHVSKH